MTRYAGRIAFAFCALLAAGFGLVRWAESCADPGDPFQDYSQHPDVPFDKYARGQLGIVQPTFAKSYLVVAYRYFSGVPLTKDEQDAALALWINRYIEPSNVYDSADAEAQKQNAYLQQKQDDSEGPQDWTAARSEVVSSDTPQINQMQGGQHYNEYVNCSNDAFATAAATLKQLVAKFGKNNPGVQEWISAQDAVFSNCGGDPDKPALPAPADSSLPAIFRFDREYQTAAAYMYSDHYDQAITGFQQIANEKDSPWHDIAAYLVARSMLRQATNTDLQSNAPNGQLPFNPEQMRGMVDYTRGLLAESPNRPFAVPLQNLLDRAEFRLHPDEQRIRMAERLRTPAPPRRFYNWLWDYTWLFDRVGAPSTMQKDPLSDWIFNFQMRDAANNHVLQAWRAHPESVPWLVALLAQTRANSPNVSEIVSAAGRLPSNSPAYLTVFYHRMRLKNDLHGYKDVRQSIDTLLASPTELPSVTRDALLDLRLDAAADLNDAVRFLPRENCSVNLRQPPPNCPGTIADHPARYLDSLPLDPLLEVLHHKDLPDSDKSQFAPNVWMRAVILGRYDVAQSLDAQVFRPGGRPWPVAPEAVAKLVAEFESAATPAAKQFAAIFLLQHQYAFGYQMGTDYPWCASPTAFLGDPAQWQNAPPVGGHLPAPPYLSEAQRKQVATEQAQLDAMDSQANYYTKVVLEYAERNRDDPRVPEALSRAVKNTRMNCNNPRTGALSEAAFDLLHKRYAETSWAKNTKYWYGDGF